MLNFLSNIPIFRRLFIAFAIAAVIPGVIIVLLGNFYLSSLNTRGQAVVTIFNAQHIASQQQNNLQAMNAFLQTRFYQIFVSLSGKVTDPSSYAAGALIDIDIHNRQAAFDQALKNYQNDYAIA